MTSIATILLSGAAGALLATGLQSLFSFWVERVKLKAEVLLSVVSWTDDAYVRLIDLHVSKEAAYTGGKAWLPPEQYDSNSRELRALLIRNAMSARVAVVYGEGDELALLNELRDSFLAASRILWAAKSETWATANSQVHMLFETKIDPLRRQMETRLLRQGSFPMLLLGLKGRVRTEPKWFDNGPHDERRPA